MLLPFSSVDLNHIAGQIAYLRLLKDCNQEQRKEYNNDCLLEQSLVFVCNEVIIAEVLAYPMFEEHAISMDIAPEDGQYLLQIQVKLLESEFLDEQLLPLLLMAAISVWEQSDYQQVFYQIQKEDQVSDFLNTGFSHYVGQKNASMDNMNGWLSRGIGSFYQKRSLVIVQNEAENRLKDWQGITPSIVRQIQNTSDNEDDLSIVQQNVQEFPQSIRQAIDEAGAIHINCVLYKNSESFLEGEQNNTIILTGVFKHTEELICWIQTLTSQKKYVFIPIHAVQVNDMGQSWIEIIATMDRVELLQDNFYLDS